MSDVEVMTQVLRSVVQARETFLTLARWLHSRARVVEVKSDLDARCFDSGVCVECFVEAELDTGDFVCWWVDLREGEWWVEPSLFIQHRDGQDDLAERSTRPVRTSGELGDVLNAVVAELTGSPERTLQEALVWKPEHARHR